MREFLLLFLIILNVGQVTACSWDWKSFCFTIASSPEETIITGRIVAIDKDGLDMKVIEVLRGEESSTTIRIWDGTDFDCNGIRSMAASTIGAEEEVYIIALETITEIENSWDVIGDYRRPMHYGRTPELKVDGEIVTGFISGIDSAPIEFQTRAATYSSVRAAILANVNCWVISEIALGLDESNIGNFVIMNRLSDSMLSVQFSDEFRMSGCNVYSMNGQLQFRKELGNYSQIDISFEALPTGIYIIELFDSKKQSISYKIAI